MKSFWDAKVIDEVLIWAHPNGRPTRTDWYPAGTPVLDHRPWMRYHQSVVSNFLDRIQVLLCFETPFDWDIIGYCRSRGIRTVLVPMYEWHLEKPPFQFDAYVNPSLLDQEYFPWGTYLPIPVDPLPWRLRTRAEHFVHNAGHVGSRCHKGTLEVLQAIPLTKADARFTIRCQHPDRLARLVAESGLKDDPRVTFDTRPDLTREELFATGDVYLAPEKYNGLSLPLQEAFASGMPVMTTDRFPTNKWLPIDGPDGTQIMIPVKRAGLVRAAPGHLEIVESVVTPEDVAERIDLWYGKDLTGLSEAGRKYAEENSWDVLRDPWLKAIRGE